MWHRKVDTEGHTNEININMTKAQCRGCDKEKQTQKGKYCTCEKWKK